MSLSEESPVDTNGNEPDETGDARPNIPPPRPNPQTTNHFFHFDGMQIFKPSFIYIHIYENLSVCLSVYLINNIMS